MNIERLLAEFPTVEPREKNGPSIAEIIIESNGGPEYNEDDDPFFESDADFFEHNRFAAVWFLENADALRTALEQLAKQPRLETP